ncbi:MAG: hypothetical protein V3U59_01620 [Gammaproteobacteria bacterium]
MKEFAMLMRREIWENPAFWVTMLVVSLLFLGSGIPQGLYHLGREVGFSEAIMHLAEAPEGALGGIYSAVAVIIGVIFNAIMLFVLFFYLLDALYADRKDRSILFWKSLPVTDTQTVLSKLVTAMFVIPAYALAAILGTFLVLLVVVTVVAWMGGGSAWGLIWSQVPFIQIVMFLVYAFVVQSLWWLPLIGWALFASAFARRTPFLWVVLPPVVVVLLEQTLFASHRFAEWLGDRFVGVFPLAIRDEDFQVEIDDDRFEVLGEITQLIDPTPLLTSPGLWVGFVIGGAFIAGAIWLRRYRDES